MIFSWMLYSVVVALLLGCAALAAERILRLYRKPTRWIWLMALLAAVFLPLAGLFFPDAIPQLVAGSGTDTGAAELAGTAWHLPRPFAVSATLGFIPRDSMILALWIATSFVLLTLYTWSLRRLLRELRRCFPSEVGGIPVLVSAAMGPAVVGLKRPEIVVPSWVLDCEEDVRRLIARHELEHVRQGDQYLQLGALLIVLLIPWNVALWWYAARLRLAIEADCDLRLLNSGASIRVYSRLLLDVGTRLSSAPVPALTFSRNRSSLFRRIHLMTSKPRKRFAQATMAATATLTLAVLACETPTPPQTADGAAVAPTLATADAELSASSNVVVRGRVKITSEDGIEEASPLFVVDGVIMDEASGFNLQDLDPDTIDRIEVLKGATAMELYGERAAAGVIQIFLKTGVENQEN